MWEAQRNIPEDMCLMSFLMIFSGFVSLRFNISQITVAPGDPLPLSNRHPQLLFPASHCTRHIPVITLKLNSFILISISKYGLMTLAFGYYHFSFISSLIPS